jgi:hypothetical protein
LAKISLVDSKNTSLPTLIVATDNDDAGNQARLRIREDCKRLFNIIDVVPSKKDFGDMTKDEIHECFRGVL